MPDDQAVALARGLVQITDAAGKPDTSWRAGSRATLAREVLGVPEDGPPRALARTDEGSGSG